MKVYQQIFHYFQVYKRYIGRRLYIVFGLMALASVTEAVGITMMLPLLSALDVGTGNQELEGSRVNQILQGALIRLGIEDSVLGILGFIAGIFILKGLILFSAQAYQAYLQAELLKEIKSRVFHRYLTMDYGYYSRQNTGHFVNMINGQINGFVTGFFNFKAFLAYLVTTCVFFATSLLVAWEFALMAIGAGIVIFAFFKRLNKYVHRLSRKASQEKSHLNKMIVQTMQSFKYLSSTAGMSHTGAGVMQSVNRLAHYMRNKGIASAFTEAVREPLAVCLMLLIVVVQIAVLEVPLVSVVVALVLFYRAILGIMKMQSKWQKTLMVMGSFDMVENEVSNLSLHQEKSGSVVMGEFSRGIELEEVTFAYGKSGEPVLKNVSIEIPANTTTALVGESGSGKSTLVDLLTLLLRPQSGTVRIDGILSNDIELDSWRRQIGYVSQETVMFDDTIANNISLWKGCYTEDAEVRANIERAAEQACIAALIRSLPQGFNTPIGDRGVRLSGGQRQRLFLARELFKRPNLLILDEATSAMDAESEKYIQQSIDALKGKMTLVIIAHRLATIKDADRIYVLDKGRVVESGSFQSLTEIENGSFRKMVCLQKI